MTGLAKLRWPESPHEAQYRRADNWIAGLLSVALAAVIAAGPTAILHSPIGLAFTALWCHAYMAAMRFTRP